MDRNQIDPEALRAMIKEILEPFMTKVDAQNIIMNHRLSSIDEELKKTNSRTTKLEEKVVSLHRADLIHQYECPLLTRVDILEKASVHSEGKHTMLKVIGVSIVTALTAALAFLRILRIISPGLTG